MEKLTKRRLEIILSKMSLPKNLKREWEQYPTPGPLAARILWIAHATYNDIYDKYVLDLGTGSGVFAIGAAILGAKCVLGIDIDFSILTFAKKYAEEFSLSNLDFHCVDVKYLNLRQRMDTVIQNPPFGVHRPGSDVLFLDSALKVADVVYSIHKLETLDYILRYLEKKDFRAEILFRDIIPIPPLYPRHREKWHPVRIFVVRIHR